MDRANSYQTISINLASYLLSSQKVQLLSLDKSNPKEIIFIFADLDLCNQLVEQYWADEALVNPKLLHMKQAELKNRIFI